MGLGNFSLFQFHQAACQMFEGSGGLTVNFDWCKFALTEIHLRSSGNRNHAE